MNKALLQTVMETLHEASRQLEVLWVSHHANRTDYALAQCAFAMKLVHKVLEEKDDVAPLLEALKDAYPYVDNDELRARIGAVIAKSSGETA